MNFDFLKTPSSLACLAIIVVFFLSVTPYFKLHKDANKDRNEKAMDASVSGLGILTENASLEGSDVDEDDRTGIKHAWFSFQEKLYEKNKDNMPKDEYSKFLSRQKEKYKPLFGTFDKMGVVVILGAFLLLFVAYQKSSDQKQLLDDDKLFWVKSFVIIFGLIYFSRFCLPFGLSSFLERKDDLEISFAVGSWISLISLIILALDDKLAKLMGK